MLKRLVSWKNTDSFAELLDPRIASVTVRTFECGCKAHHEHSDLANKHEFDHCGNHPGMPNPVVSTVEYFM